MEVYTKTFLLCLQIRVSDPIGFYPDPSLRKTRSGPTSEKNPDPTIEKTRIWIRNQTTNNFFLLWNHFFLVPSQFVLPTILQNEWRNLLSKLYNDPNTIAVETILLR